MRNLTVVILNIFASLPSHVLSVASSPATLPHLPLGSSPLLPLHQIPSLLPILFENRHWGGGERQGKEGGSGNYLNVFVFNFLPYRRQLVDG